MDNIFKKFKNALDRNFEEALVENESIVNRVLVLCQDLVQVKMRSSAS
jgi:hypothetical protein